MEEAERGRNEEAPQRSLLDLSSGPIPGWTERIDLLRLLLIQAFHLFKSQKKAQGRNMLNPNRVWKNLEIGGKKKKESYFIYFLHHSCWNQILGFLKEHKEHNLNAWC